ncbi:MAG: hypothetical protein Q9170_005117 [Blastenia crenularia]
MASTTESSSFAVSIIPPHFQAASSVPPHPVSSPTIDETAYQKTLEDARHHYGPNKPEFTVQQTSGSKIGERKTIILSTSKDEFPATLKGVAQGVLIGRRWNEKFMFWTLDVDSQRLIVKCVKGGRQPYYPWLGVGKGLGRKPVAFVRGPGPRSSTNPFYKHPPRIGDRTFAKSIPKRRGKAKESTDIKPPRKRARVARTLAADAAALSETDQESSSDDSHVHSILSSTALRELSPEIPLSNHRERRQTWPPIQQQTPDTDDETQIRPSFTQAPHQTNSASDLKTQDAAKPSVEAELSALVVPYCLSYPTPGHPANSSSSAMKKTNYGGSGSSSTLRSEELQQIKRRKLELTKEK